jgi:hypothetical protein
MNAPKLELLTTVEQDRPEPMFSVGQIAVMKSLKREMPFRVTSVDWIDGDWFYGWDSKNVAHQHMVRKATLEEIGMGDVEARIAALIESGRVSNNSLTSRILEVINENGILRAENKRLVEKVEKWAGIS